MLAAGSGFAMAQTNDVQADRGNQERFASNSYCDSPRASVDGNDDGFIDENEATGAVENRFGQIDQDGNGQITKTEWVDCVSKSRDMSSAESDRSADNFADADTNKDQEIDAAEYRDLAEESYQAFQQDRSSDEQSKAGSNEAASAEDDSMPIVVLRRYVWLTPEEAGDDQAMRDMSADEAAGRAAANFSSLDSNGDGILDTNEWSKRSSPPGVSEDIASANFDEMDEDASGAISREEFASANAGSTDETTTASTDDKQKSGSATDGSADAAAGTPVFIYRFMPF
jgi:Ca2+-binding EF-hand superfamily protein